MENGYFDRFAFVLAVLMTILMSLCHIANAEPSAAAAAAVFVFGDSTVDIGTNTLLPQSIARADHPYYGIDLFNSSPIGKPTGRFSNGLNAADFIAKFMGHKSSPPSFLSFETAHASIYLQKKYFLGFNFASAGSGIFDDTGSTLGVVTLTKQIRQFEGIQKNLTTLWGSEATEAYLNKSVFFFSTGSNDIFGYLQSNSTELPKQFFDLLMNGYESSIRTLYSLGARKFGITSVGPLGCCPAQRLLNQTGGCFEVSNDFARTFYYALGNRLNNLSSELHGMKYSLGNAYQVIIDMIKYPRSHYLENVEAACCGFGKLNAEKFCNATASLCPDRTNYLFWDPIHPTQAAARIAAGLIYNGPPKYASPINLAMLVNDI